MLDAASVWLTIPPSSLPTGAAVFIRALNDAPRVPAGYVLLGKAAEIRVENKEGNALADTRAKVCLRYGDAQLAQAGGEARSLAILHAPRLEGEGEVLENQNAGTETNWRAQRRARSARSR